MMDGILKFESVSYRYKMDARPILEEATFCIEKGAFFLVKGDSGEGKSTLLRLCCRLEEPDKGRILFKGVPVSALDPSLLRRKIGYVQQTPTLAPGSIRKNLLLAFKYKSSQGTFPPSEKTIRAFLDEFQLSEFSLEDSATDLSLGQKQRICLIRAILMEPEIMLLDEPTSALDAKSAAIVINRARAVNRDKKVTILMVTHGKEDWEFVKAGVIEINAGKVSII